MIKISRDSRAMPLPIHTLGQKFRWFIVWTHFQMESQKNVWPVSSPGPTASWYLGLLFGHAPVPLDDHEKPQHLQDTPQQSHLLWREPHLLPTKQEKDSWKPSVKATPHNSCGHESFLSAAPVGFWFSATSFHHGVQLSDYQWPILLPALCFSFWLYAAKHMRTMSRSWSLECNLSPSVCWSMV